MPKLKSHKGLGKRFKFTSSGKIKHKRSCGSHLMSGKSAKRKRRVASSAIMTDTTAKKIKTRLSK